MNYPQFEGTSKTKILAGGTSKGTLDIEFDQDLGSTLGEEWKIKNYFLV